MVEDRHALQQLLKSPAWERLVKQFTEDLKALQIEVNSVDSGFGDVLEKAFKKGEMARIGVFFDFPKAEIEFLTEQIEELEEQIARMEADVEGDEPIPDDPLGCP